MKAICKICYHYELCKEDERCLPEYLNCNFFKNKLDVVEVVRCKECKYCEWVDDVIIDVRHYFCEMYNHTNVDADGYCYKGERKCDK